MEEAAPATSGGADAPSPASPSSPLLEFVALAAARAAAQLRQRAAALVHRSNAAGPPSMAAPATAAALRSLASPVLTWPWFRAEWRASGCRLLPLLSLSLQSQRTLLHSTAWFPLSASASAALQSPLHRPCGFPSANTRPLLTEAYDVLTAQLTNTSPSPPPLLQRWLLYCALYALFHSQATVEKYPIPCSRHLWERLIADCEAFAQLPVSDCAQLLRRMAAERCFMLVAAYGARVLKGPSDFQRRRRRKAEGGEGKALDDLPSRAAPSPANQRRRRRWTAATSAHATRRGGDADEGEDGTGATRREDPDKGREDDEEEQEEGEEEEEERRVAAGEEGGGFERIRETAQRRFDRWAEELSSGRGGAQLTAALSPPPPDFSGGSPSPPLPRSPPLPPSAAAAARVLSSLRLSAWLSSGRPLPLRSVRDPSWQRELEGEAALAPSPFPPQQSPPCAASLALQRHLSGLSVAASAYATALHSAEAEIEEEANSSGAPASPAPPLLPHLVVAAQQLAGAEGEQVATNTPPLRPPLRLSRVSPSLSPSPPHSFASFLQTLLGSSFPSSSLPSPSPTLRLLREVDERYQAAQQQRTAPVHRSLARSEGSALTRRQRSGLCLTVRLSCAPCPSCAATLCCCQSFAAFVAAAPAKRESAGLQAASDEGSAGAATVEVEGAAEKATTPGGDGRRPMSPTEEAAPLWKAEEGEAVEALSPRSASPPPRRRRLAAAGAVAVLASADAGAAPPPSSAAARGPSRRRGRQLRTGGAAAAGETTADAAESGLQQRRQRLRSQQRQLEEAARQVLRRSEGRRGRRRAGADSTAGR